MEIKTKSNTLCLQEMSWSKLAKSVVVLAEIGLKGDISHGDVCMHLSSNRSYIRINKNADSADYINPHSKQSSKLVYHNQWEETSLIS